MKRSLFFLLLFANCTSGSKKSLSPLPGEVAFKNVEQMTSGEINTQARWSFHDDQIIFQRKGKKGCSSVFILDVNRPKLLAVSLSQDSNSQTSPSFLPTKDRFLLSVSPKDSDCSNPTNYQMLLLKRDGSDPIPAEPAAPLGYHSNVDICRKGKAVFTSDRDGEKTLFLADIDDKFGTFSNIKPVPNLTGKNENARFTPDCSKFVWQHSVLKGYEIKTGNQDGTDIRIILRVNEPTSPVFTPDGNHILFAKDRSLYQIHTSGRALKRISFSEGEEKDPSFSQDGKKIVFSSSRGGDGLEMNLFIADWIRLSDTSTVEDQTPDTPNQKTSSIKIAAPKKDSLTKIPGHLGVEIDRSSQNSSALGVKIKSIAPDSPAMKAGLLKGDRVVGLIGANAAHSVLSAEKFDAALKSFKPREQIKIQIRRGSQLELIELEATLNQKH